MCRSKRFSCKHGIKAITKPCKTCGKMFHISKGELQWLREKGLKEFARCRDCRKHGTSYNVAEMTLRLENLMGWISSRIEELKNPDAEEFKSAAYLFWEQQFNTIQISDLEKILSELYHIIENERYYKVVKQHYIEKGGKHE